MPLLGARVVIQIRIISDVRSDWSSAGLDPGNLCFTLVSAYQPNRNGYADPSFSRLSSYRAVLDEIAANDAGVSFIDIWETGPTWQQAVANGYLADFVHPSDSGTRLYGRLLMDQLMPTPGDANIDGSVNFDDLLDLAQHYGQAVADWRSGDFDGIGGVGFDDLLLLVQNYEQSSEIASGDFQADWQLARSIVPEPASALALLSLTATRRRRSYTRTRRV